MRSTFNILFYVNKSKEKNGVVPVMGRVTINGTQSQFSCKKSVPLDMWDVKGNCAKGRSKEALQINRELDNIKAQIIKHYQHLSDREAFVTAEIVRNAYQGFGSEYETLLSAFDKDIANQKKRVGKDRVASTLWAMQRSRKDVAEFIQSHYRRTDMSMLELKDIPYKLIESDEVPNTPLMRNFLYTFEFCRRRYIEESNFDELVGYDFDNDKFLFLLCHNFGIGVNRDADWTLESMKELMLYIEAETKPEYREMLKVEMENYGKQRQELLDLFVFCNKQKTLHFDSNPAFTDIDFDLLNQHLYNDYHIYLSAADRRTLNTVGSMINHIIYRLKDGNGSL